MNDYKRILEKFLKENQVKCFHKECQCTDIGVDNWGMFEGERDWFFYCKKCDDTFGLITAQKNSIKR